MGLIHPVPVGADDGIGHLHALDDLAEGGVLAVQVGGLLHHDEELAAGGVGVHGPGHGENTPVVLEGVAHAVVGELALDGVAGAAHAVAVGAAALDHEAGDHPVEDQAVVEAGLHQADEVVHRVGSHLGVELGDHLAAVLHLNGDNGVLSHVISSFPGAGPRCFLSSRGGRGSSWRGPSPAWRPWPRRRPACHRASCPWPGRSPASPAAPGNTPTGAPGRTRPASPWRKAAGSPACASAAGGRAADPC